MTFAPVDPDLDPDELDMDLSESSEPEVIESSTSTIVRSGKDVRQAPGSAVELDARSEADSEAQKKAHEAARMESLEKLQMGARRNSAAGSAESRRSTGKDQGIVKLSWKRGNQQMSSGRYQTTSNPDAVIVLKEEKVRSFAPRFTTLISSVSQASTFHDFLRFVYPGYGIYFPAENRAIVLTDLWPQHGMHNHMEQCRRSYEYWK